MKTTLKLFFTITFFSFFLVSNHPVLGQEILSTDEQYCNGRYQYCLSYPNTYFDGAIRTDNSDGITLQSTQYNTQLIVAGAYNILDWSLDEIYENNFEKLTLEADFVNLIEYQKTETSCQSLYEFNDRFIFFKAVLLKDKHVTLKLEVGKDDSYLLPIIQEQIRLAVDIQ